MKSNILASLESQHLVHKAAIERPIESAEEEEAAVRQAAKETRRLERKAQKLGIPTPPAREPKRTVTFYAWKLGPPQPSAALPQSDSGAGPSKTEMDNQWDRAENLELAYHANREMEEIAIEQRRTARRERFKVERERMKAQRAEDERMGRMDDIKREKERKNALAKIRAYAEETGEDVSGWYEELGEIIRPKMDGGSTGDHGTVDIEEELGIPMVWKGEGVFGLRGKGGSEGSSGRDSFEQDVTVTPRQPDRAFPGHGSHAARPASDGRIRTSSGFGIDRRRDDEATDRSSASPSHIAGLGLQNRLTDSERPPWLDRTPPGYSPRSRPGTSSSRSPPSFSPRTPRGGADDFRPQTPTSGKKSFGLRA